MTDTDNADDANRTGRPTDDETTLAGGSPTASEPEPPATDRTSRRGVLRSAATAAAIGVSGLAATSGTAAAGDGECPYSFSNAPSWFGEIEPESWDFYEWPWGTDELTIFIHGFTNTTGGRDYAYEVYRNLSDSGYSAPVVACDWNAGNSVDDWYWAKDHSIVAGQDLAEILDYYGWTADHGVRVNLIAHSLGGKMALECVRELEGTYGHSINSVNLFGAAVWDEQPGDRFYDAVRYGTNETHNYYSVNDDTLGDWYQTAEFGRHACGYTGSAGGEPWNWYDHDMSNRIHHHCEYMDYNAGCVWYVDDDL